MAWIAILTADRDSGVAEWAGKGGRVSGTVIGGGDQSSSKIEIS